MTVRPDDIPENIWSTGSRMAVEYDAWLNAGNSVGNLSEHAVEAMADTISRAIMAERKRIRYYAKSALNGFDTLDTETAIENAKSDLHSIILHMGHAGDYFEASGA